MLDIVEHRIVCDCVSEVNAYRFVYFARALVTLCHESLYSLQLLCGACFGIKLYSCRGSKLYNAVLREILDAASVIAGPLINHCFLIEVHGNESKLVDPARDISGGINVSARLARAHGDAEHSGILEAHCARKRGDVAVVCNLNGDLASELASELLGNIGIHMLDVLLEILVRHLEEKRRYHDLVVNVNSGRGYADTVNARHM